MKANVLPIRIIVADDHEIFRDGFAALIHKHPGIHLVAEASNGEQLLQLVKKLLPDVVLIDIEMPVMDGITATRYILKDFPQTNVIALSMFNHEHVLQKMIDAGAKGYLLKNADKKDIIKAIEAAHDNIPYYCQDTSAKLARLKRKQQDESEFNLTEKEKEIIIYICQGLTSKEISAKLHLSIRTIEGYRENIMQKTHARKTAGIINMAMKHKHLFPGL
jgi:two-component system, NarL family, response regulator NreC